jgi:heme exporter protein CcmD
MTFATLLDPAGHGPYILASFGISLIVLLWNIVVPLVQGHHLRREIRNEIRARKAIS